MREKKKKKGKLPFISIAAWSAGILMLVSSACYLFWPKEMIYEAGVESFRSILNHQTLYWVTYLTFMFSALFGLSVVMAVTELVQSANRNLIRWIGLLGIIGLSVIVVNFWYHPGTNVNRVRLKDTASCCKAMRKVESGFHPSPTARRPKPV
jgi:hypothetical protein